MFKKLLSPRAVYLSLIAAFLCCMATNTHAQITLYSRTVLTGQTYAPMVGGTVINTNAGLSAGSMSTNADDGAVLVNLPFTFPYDNNNFTQATFCTNGWVGLGNQLTVSAANGRIQGNLFTGTVPNNTLAAWFGDMSANFPGPAGVGSMRHGLTAPGEYTFEWRNATGSGFGSTAVNLINFMIKIYGQGSATPGRIEMLYGTQAGALTTGRAIGIEDAVGGPNRFINALNGSFTLTTTATAWPGNGNGYRFDPPPPCVGTPTAGTVNAPANVCPGANFNLALSGHSVGPGILYQWQSRTLPGGTFANIPAATTAAITTNTTVPREYRCVVTCFNSAQTVNTAPVSIGINSFYVCYCKTGLGGSTAASIDSVIISGTTLRNGSPGTAPGFYTQYQPVGSLTTSLQAGGLYTLTVKYGSAAAGSLWIDANQNNVFEASEWTRINTNATTGEVVFQVPPTALSGLTGMRIRSSAPTASNGAANACSNIASGEIEDYVINITPAPVNDIKLQALLSPLNGVELCPYKNIPARIVVYNNGSAPQTNFTVTVNLTGPVPATNSFVYSNVLAPFRTDTLWFTSYVLQIPGMYRVQAHTALSGDVNIFNDSSTVNTFTLNGSANPPIVRKDSVCFGEEAVLRVLPDGYKHNWYMTSVYGTKVFTGDTLRIPNLQRDTFFYVCSEPATNNTGSLTTTTAAGNGCGGGAMFNIVPNVNMRVDSFAALFAATGNQTVNVYYRLGSFAGNETNASAWTLLGTANITVGSTTVPTVFTVNTPLNVTVGNTYGIYVNYNASYTNGNTTFSNTDMIIQTGTGLCGQFTGTNASRMFNGTVYYSIGPKICESPLEPIGAYAGPAPVVNLGKDIKACEGQNIILDAGHFGASYRWNTVEFTQTINVKDAPGTYWVEVDKYCIASDTVTVELDPLPKTSGISYQRVGNAYIFTAAGLQFADKVLWNFGDGTTSTAVTPQHTYATGGIYKVLLILTNKCGSDTTELLIPLGINNIASQNDKVLLYPNPANSSITLEYEEMPANADIIVVNMLGAVVLQQKATNAAKQVIDISSLPAGNYILKLQSDKMVANKPFTVSR
ncbi:hypothetical protein CAP35_00785 [Chitinophagaceae bacterium IBVUCB1]|nr:hypothetical protein CAP35_00785 [Chitinophagaceae bacterium IBVUCB1]